MLRRSGDATDFVVARDGTVMHGLALIYVLRDLPQVAGFHIVQESLEHLGCRWCRAGFDADTVGRIEHGLAARLGEGADRRGAGCRIAPEVRKVSLRRPARSTASEVSCAT